jgi:hypothetical protein
VLHLRGEDGELRGRAKRGSQKRGWPGYSLR